MEIKTMVILNEDLTGVQMFQFETDKIFKVGEVIEHEKLECKHIVRFVDSVTVQVQPFSSIGLVQNEDGTWGIDMSIL